MWQCMEPYIVVGFIAASIVFEPGFVATCMHACSNNGENYEVWRLE